MEESKEIFVNTVTRRTTKLTGVSATLINFYGWKCSHYFVVEDDDMSLRSRCTVCPPSKKPLSTAYNATSNFKELCTKL